MPKATKIKRATKDNSPPKPWILGTGGARKAASAIKGRDAQLKAQLDKALSGRKKK